MTNILKITLVAFAVLSGISAAHAVHPDDNPTVADQIFEEQSRHGS